MANKNSCIFLKEKNIKSVIFLWAGLFIPLSSLFGQPVGPTEQNRKNDFYYAKDQRIEESFKNWNSIYARELPLISMPSFNIVTGFNRDEEAVSLRQLRALVEAIRSFDSIAPVEIKKYEKHLEDKGLGYDNKLLTALMAKNSISQEDLFLLRGHIEITGMISFFTCQKEQKSYENNIKPSEKNAPTTIITRINLFNLCANVFNRYKEARGEFLSGKINLEQFSQQVSPEKLFERKVAPEPPARRKGDIVAQVLNYAAGLDENGGGSIYFHPVNTEGGSCIYQLVFDQSSIYSSIQSGIHGLINQAAANERAITGRSDTPDYKSPFDLAKANLSNITFYETRGPGQNQFTGQRSLLRYKSRVEGTPDIFECESNTCNIDRLRRGWALVQSKCKGAKKAF